MKQVISAFWIGIIFLSLLLISLHRHDHSTDDHSSCNTTQEHSHDHQDCTYCFLFYHQSYDQIQHWYWDATAKSFDVKQVLGIISIDAVFIRKFYSKGLRAPPLPISYS